MNYLFSNRKIQDRHSDYLIRMVHNQLIIYKDLEMEAKIELQFWTKDEAGDWGIPVLQAIQENEAITQRQKDNDSAVYATRIWKSSTRGSKVFPETGELVKPDEQGNYPEGVITQLAYWQSHPETIFPGDTLAEKVYSALLGNMEEVFLLDNI